MKRGVIGLGDSFTWGEGLYLQSNYVDLPLKKTHSFDMSEMRLSFLEFKNRYRFINLVGNYLDTWSLTKEGNGGSNLTSLIWLNEMIRLRKLRYEDIGLIIFQFSGPERDGDAVTFDIFFDELKKNMKIWEDYNIKYYFVSWPELYEHHPIYQEHLIDKHIYIEHPNGEVVFGWDKWTKHEDSTLTIMNEFKDVGMQVGDGHLNINGHQIVANSIINKLIEDNFTKNQLII